MYNNLYCFHIRQNIYQIELMQELGILALDLFPYSFSMDNNFNYRNKNSFNRTAIKPNIEHKKITKEILHSNLGYIGINGWFRFDVSGRVERRPLIFHVGSDKFVIRN